MCAHAVTCAYIRCNQHARSTGISRRVKAQGTTTAAALSLRPCHIAHGKRKCSAGHRALMMTPQPTVGARATCRRQIAFGGRGHRAVVWHSVPAMGLRALIRALDLRPASNLVIVTVILFIILDGGAHAALSGFTPMCTRASQRTQRLSFAGSLQGKIMFSSWPSSSGLRPSKGPVWPDSWVRRLSLKPSVLAHSPASGICHFVQPVSSPATLAIHARVPAR